MVLQYVCIFNLPEIKHSCVYYTVRTAVNFYSWSALILYVTKPERPKDPLNNLHVSRAEMLLKSDILYVTSLVKSVIITMYIKLLILAWPSPPPSVVFGRVFISSLKGFRNYVLQIDIFSSNLWCSNYKKCHEEFDIKPRRKSKVIYVH